jgi:predicted ATPase
LRALSRAEGFAAYVVQGTPLRGWAVAEQGHVEEGIEQLREGLAANRAIRAEFMQPCWLILLADVYRQVGQAGHGLSVLAEALAIVHATGQHVYEAELHRLQGELLLQAGVQDLASGVLTPDAVLQTLYAEAQACLQHQPAGNSK